MAATLITGLSTRAIAQSAVRGGHRVITLDYFGDRDQAESVPNLSLKRHLGLPFSAQNLLRASHQLEYQAVVYTSNLENHPEVVAALAQGKTLLGNPPHVLRHVRDWQALGAFCVRHGIPFPATLLPGEEEAADPGKAWLVKPRRSGGGHGIDLWSGQPLSDEHLLQQYISGQPASAAFVADGRRSVLLGLTEQIIGSEDLGGRGFAWCGNILPLALPPSHRARVLEQVESLVQGLVAHFGLRGASGVDLIVSPDLQVYLIEVNPRYTASMELVERAYGLNLFGLHLAALEGRLPDWDLADHLEGPWFGKGIVYAHRTVTVPDTAGWLGGERRDVPFSADRVQAGHPVCTVLAEGAERRQCWDRLLVAANAVRQEIGDSVGEG